MLCAILTVSLPHSDSLLKFKQTKHDDLHESTKVTLNLISTGADIPTFSVDSSEGFDDSFLVLKGFLSPRATSPNVEKFDETLFDMPEDGDGAEEDGPVRQPAATNQLCLHPSAVNHDTHIAPVIMLREQDCLLKRMAIKARVVGNSQSSVTYSMLAVIQETETWDPESYRFASCLNLAHEYVGRKDHFVWIGSNVSTNLPEHGAYFPLSIYVAYVEADSLYIMELSSNGRHVWIQSDFLHKSDEYPKKIKQAIRKIGKLYRSDTFYLKQLSVTPDITNSILGFESTLKIALMASMKVGLFYRKEGQNTLEEITNNKLHHTGTERLKQFLEVLQCNRRNEEGDRVSRWMDFPVKWHVAPELSKDKIRQLVGNCLGVIIFNDAPDPIEPSQLFLGQITTTVVVVQPHLVKVGTSGKTETRYRVGLYLNYETKYNLNTISMEKARAYSEKKIQDVSFGPNIPKNFALDSTAISDFVLTLLYNGIHSASVHHDLVRRQFRVPFAYELQTFGETFAPTWLSKIQGKSKK